MCPNSEKPGIFNDIASSLILLSFPPPFYRSLSSYSSALLMSTMAQRPQLPGVLECRLSLSRFVPFPDSFQFSPWEDGTLSKEIRGSSPHFGEWSPPPQAPMLIDHLSTLPDVVMRGNESCHFAFTGGTL
ncbi:hypothetical protein JD844_014722 [Phrynosoma platyrhinos]|uniref:Uncharacterized protein n=1 Tax=Phrynosoma platyrhinos TaxID=52577 RepID=A0ABQ7SRT2_PHRPL|nr:hypothetical protein JD844_014722 [Phrynosoma platyrhinos]